MIERAEELGGRCRVENRAGDGTRVQAALPADERRAGEPTREHRDRPG
jgi:nitrate/nitrite-specific signal transduction histidine kinase